MFWIVWLLRLLIWIVWLEWFVFWFNWFELVNCWIDLVILDGREKMKSLIKCVSQKRRGWYWFPMNKMLTWKSIDCLLVDWFELVDCWVNLFELVNCWVNWFELVDYWIDLVILNGIGKRISLKRFVSNKRRGWYWFPINKITTWNFQKGGV